MDTPDIDRATMDATTERIRANLSLPPDIPAGSVQQYVTQALLETPYERADESAVYSLFGEDYAAGLFQLSERRLNPGFLFDEGPVPYREWVCKKASSELSLLKNAPDISPQISQYGEEYVLSDLYNVLSFRTASGKKLDEAVSNQEYSDLFRRIILLLVMHDAHYAYNSYADFNRLGRDIIPGVLQKSSHYDLCQRLIQTILGGLVGIDVKDGYAKTSPSSMSSIIPLNGSCSTSEKSDRVFRRIDAYIRENGGLAVDSFDAYYREVLCGGRKVISWFFDDYIQTMLELKFIEEQLTHNDRLFFYLVPRCGAYSNDASYTDVMDMLKLDIFANLAGLLGKSFAVSDRGMDLSTFHGFRMSKEVADIIRKSDVVVMTGARAYEMAQGLRKVTYFTGIAVCKSYTETITGFSKESGALIFLRQNPGDHSFSGFKDRAWRRMRDEYTQSPIPCAGCTAREYASGMRGM